MFYKHLLFVFSILLCINRSHNFQTHIYNFHCHLKKNKSRINLNTHIIFLFIQHNMQYAESLHEIEVKRMHYYSRTSYGFTKMCTTCTRHTDYRLSYNSDHFNTNFSYLFSDTYIVFKASILFLRRIQIQRKILCFHSFLFHKYKT